MGLQPQRGGPGDVWRRHGGARLVGGSRVRQVTGRQHGRAGGEHVDARTGVGVVGLGVDRVGRAHGEDRRDPCRTVGACAGALVAGSGGVDDAVVHGREHGRVHRVRARTTDAHVGHGRRTGHGVTGDPVDAREDIRPRSGQVATQHADRHDRHALGDAIGHPTDRPGDVGAVPVAVLSGRAPDRVEASGDPASEVGVGRAHARVQDVRGDARAGTGVGIALRERQGCLVDPVKTPRWGGLDVGTTHRGVGLDRRHALVHLQLRKQAGG